MMNFLSSAAVVAVLLSSPGIDAFAPPSRRVAVIAPEVQVHRHNGQTLPSPSSASSSNQSPRLTYLLASNDDDDINNADELTNNNSRLPSYLLPTRQSRRSQFLSNIKRKSKPITLALLTATAASAIRYGPSLLVPPPAQASAPIVLRAAKKKDDMPMVQAMKKAEELKKKKSLEEFDIFMAKANDIEEAEGKKARDAYEKEYQAEREASEVQKKLDVENLKRKLLDAGQDPHTELDAERQVFLLEHDVDLELVSGTPHNEQMIKNFQSRGRKNKGGKKKGGASAAGDAPQTNQRYIIACQVSDLKARGIDPMTHFSDKEVMDKTRAIYKMDDRVAEKVAKQYEGLMEQYGGRLTEAKGGEVPFVYSDESAAAALVADVAGGANSGSGVKEERVAAKAQRMAEKEAARNERAEAKAQARAERVAAREQAKADKAAAKENKLAEKAAGAAVALAAKEAASAGAAAASAAASSMGDGDVAATANGDVFSTAGSNAVAESSIEHQSAISSAVVKEQKTASKANDIVSTIKSYATPKNVATVVVGGGAVKFGLDYYQENNGGAQSERERQLKLLLGEDDDDEDDDDDDFDDEDDDYEKFTSKKPEPPQSKPKSNDDATPKAEKPTTPSTPPPPPAVPPAPKPKRTLGIFSKRNADARETDLNVLVGPNAQAPEFASLLAKILTFGAPGRFPNVASWGDMPFDEFDLEKAKSLLTESRGDADLADEQSAEIFASVVNCMIIDIVDLASITLKGKKKDENEKLTVDAINVVMDFMDHAASLFDAVAKDVTIKPVTYGGKLRKKDLEQMFSVYAGSSMMSLDALTGSGGTSQDRVDTLQLVFAITDKKAEGLMQKHMMKMMMNLMKDGGKGLEGMEGMPGMEGMEEMMAAMGGADGMPGMGMPGMDGGEMSPEDLKQTIGLMKELMDSGQVSEEELVEVRKQFKEMYGSDISDLIKKASDEGEAMSEDERELLAMFKQILGEE
ncbi:hypothetical protein ACHAXR_010331 [Thalassiosira sp. AJA248-18]